MLSRLVLTDFRNHAEAVLHPGRGFVVLTGDNGAGKTNVLEAVSLLAPGRGLRRAALSDMARQGGPGGFGVATTLSPSRLREGLGEGVPPVPPPERDTRKTAQALPQPLPQAGGEFQIGTGTQPVAPERRIVRINGATTSANALAEWLTVLWLTPAMDRLFVEPAGERRRFLDRLTLALRPEHASHANRYEAAMRARNRLLADDAAPDTAWLTALEAQMAEHGAAIDTGRRETVAALAGRLAGQPTGPFARAGLALEAWEGANTLAADLAQGRRRDAAAGRTLVGPHRSDLAVTHLDKAQPAALCSTGEQESAATRPDTRTRRTGRGAHRPHARAAARRGRRAPRSRPPHCVVRPARGDRWPGVDDRYRNRAVRRGWRSKLADRGKWQNSLDIPIAHRPRRDIPAR